MVVSDDFCCLKGLFNCSFSQNMVLFGLILMFNFRSNSGRCMGGFGGVFGCIGEDFGVFLCIGIFLVLQCDLVGYVNVFV